MSTTHPGTFAVPDLDRLTYFYGQHLGPLDLQGEQAYLREKHRLANRYLHGWGVVCGLEVVVSPGEYRDPHVDVRPGLALDCPGDEVVLRGTGRRLDLWRELSPEDQKRVLGGPTTLWVSICYCERPVEPARPMYVDACGIPGDCAYARIRETVTLRVSTHRPKQPDRCASCPADCPDRCVVLAEITGFERGKPLAPEQIDNGVRRMLTRHQLTTVTGISFAHGATYGRDLAVDVLDTGVEVRFSDRVRKDTLTDGVVEITVHEGGGGAAGRLYPRRGLFHSFTGEDPDDPDHVRGFVFRQRASEGLNYGDRVVITVKADFVLDDCCRAVDGNHIGGRVPLLPGYERFAVAAPPGCVASPDRPGAWVSGNGTQGGTFESWFLVEDEGRGVRP